MSNMSPKEKGSYRCRTVAHDFFIHPITGDIHDVGGEILLKDKDRRAGAPPYIHPRTGQKFDAWTGEIIGLTPEQISSIQQNKDFHEAFLRQLEERRRKEKKLEEHDE